MLDWLWDWLAGVWEWLTDWVYDVAQAIFSFFLSAVVGFFSLIPVPTWAEGLDLDWIPASMAYFLDPFNIPLGLTCITGGFLIRFLIRRLPFVG